MIKSFLQDRKPGLFLIHRSSCSSGMSFHRSTTTRFRDFPPACSSSATAGDTNPLNQPTYPTLPSPQPPSPVRDTAKDSPMEPPHQPKRSGPDQALVQGQELTGTATKIPKQACGENCRYNCKLCDWSSYSLKAHGQGRGRYLRHEHQEHFEWRKQVMGAWAAAKSKHQGCRFANSFFKHGTQPCDMGWGKALCEYMEHHDEQSIRTATPEAILTEYYGRHVHEQRRQSPKLIPVVTAIPDERLWDLDPTEREERHQPGQGGQGQPSASSRPYRRS